MPRSHALKRSIHSLIVGFILLAASVSILWWNEGRSVQAGRALGEGSIAVSTTAERIEPGNEGRLVHVSGEVQVTLPIQDSDLDLVFDNTLAVSRTVEMFQWIETPAKDQHTPREALEYKLGWSKDWQDSSKFHQPQAHPNPAMQMTSQTWTAAGAKLGAFALTEPALAKLEAVTPVDISIAPPGWTKSGTDFYLSLDPARPTLGDLRVRYAVLKAPAHVSILAQQTETGFAPYKLRNGDDLFVVQQGTQSAGQLLESQKQIDAASIWALRSASMIFLSIGVYLILGRLSPGPLPGLAPALALALPLGLSTMALAWLFYRPILSITLVLIGIGAAYALMRYRALMSQERHDPAAATPALAA